MRPMRKGAARTALTEGLAKLIEEKIGTRYGTDEAIAAAKLSAAVLGGAIEETLREMYPLAGAELQRVFWRYTNENLWRLTRALEASHILDKAGD